MDPFNALKNDVFRPLAAVVMPGVLAIAPFAILLCNAIGEVRAFYSSQPTVFFLIVAGMGTTMGMLLENIGSSIERGIDRCMDIEYLQGHDEVWGRYLSCGTEDSNGRRFLGATVTRLKFINSLIPALAVFTVGIWCLHWQVKAWNSGSLVVFSGVILLLLIYLYRTSTELSEIASTTRYYLLAPIQRPSKYNPGAETVRRYRHFAYSAAELITSKVYALNLKGRSVLWVIPAVAALLAPRVFPRRWASP